MHRPLSAVLCVLAVCFVAVAQDDSERSDVERQRAEAYGLFFEAQEHASNNRIEQARETLEKVIELDPGASRVRALLARLCMRINDMVCAEAQAIRATQAAAPDVEGHKVLAELSFTRYRSSRQPLHLESALDNWRRVVELEPQDLNVWTLLIRVLAREGRFDEAEAVAREATSTPGLDPSAPWIAMARALLATGQTERAVALLEGLDLDGRGAVPLLQMLADLKGSQDDLDGQVEVLERLYELRPQDPQLAYRYGRALLQRGDVLEAVGPIEQALESRPNDPLVRRDLSSALVSLGRGAEALPLLSELPEVYSSEQILFVWSRAAEQAGDFAMAGEKLGELIEQMASTDQAQLIRPYVIRAARTWLRAQQPKKALEQLARLDADDLESTRWTMRALHADGRSKQAASLLAESRDATSPTPEWIALQADQLAESGEADLALEKTVVEIAAQQDRTRAITQVAAYLMGWGRAGLAARVIDAIGVPENAPVEYLRARAQALYGAGRLGEAEAAYRLLLDVEPNNPGVMNDLGYLLVTRGQSLDEAVQLLERAVAASPNEPAFLDSLGWALHHAGQPERALNLLKRAVRQARSEQDVSIMREHLGDVYLALGDPERAVAEWQAALRFGGEDPTRLREKIKTHEDAATR